MWDGNHHTLLVLLIVIILHDLGEEVSLLRAQRLGHLDQTVDSSRKGQRMLVMLSPKTAELASDPAYGDKKEAPQSPVASMSVGSGLRRMVSMVFLKEAKRYAK